MSEQRITIKDIEPLAPFSRGSTEIFLTGHWSSKKPSWVEKTSPCRQACPVGNDIARAFSAASRGDIDEALRIFREDNPFPGVCGRVCYHPCEGDCNRKGLDEAVNIRGFERYLADHGRPETKPVAMRNEKVAVVGSGPAGLAAAFHLAKRGYPVTVFEALPEPGGMLMFGIPEYRLPRDVLKREIDEIRRLGVEIRTGVRVGADLPLAELRKGYKALFLAIGAHKGVAMDGAIDGIDFLRRVNSGEKVALGEKVAVIGGGNTAVDCARVLRRLGVKQVTIVYRRSRAEMPALPEDVEAVEREGVRIEFLAAPETVRRGSLGCLRMELGEADESGRRRPVPVEGGGFEVPADTVIAAIGQVPDSGFVGEIGVQVAGTGMIRSESSSATNVEGVFAGGDGAGGTAFVADAIAAGKKAALAISCYLEKKDEAYEYERRRIGARTSFSAGDSQNVDLKHVVPYEELNSICFPYAPRNGNPSLGKEAVGSFKETTGGLDPGEAEREISRCFKCGTCTECDLCFLLCPDISVIKEARGYSVKTDYCKGCGVCATTCPRNAITMGGGR
jgi:NADPH-dependent glutamate synthase beta subunit-like oxidoreductase